MRAALVVMALFGVALAGCLESDPLDVESNPDPSESDNPSDNVTINETVNLTVKPRAPALLGKAPFENQAVECPCPPQRIDLDEAAATDGWLDIRVTWDGTKVADMNATLQGPDGSQWFGDRGFDATRIKVPQAKAGSYLLELGGTGNATVQAFLDSVSGPKSADGRLLPNIVVLVPEQVAFGDCDSVERNEQGAKRCLRLGNAIGNTGDGPVEVFLNYDQAALALGSKLSNGVQGQFIQRIRDVDGVVTDTVVGHADFHEATSHLHWHYDGFADFKLYQVDPVTGLRGTEAATGHKTGFCFLDWDPMQEQETSNEAGGRAAQDCLVPGLNAATSFGSSNQLDAADGWSMGISAGWFDFYWSRLTDQYVEASDVTDGLYELVSVADPEDWLEEVNEEDNAASVLIRINGDQVKVVERRGWYDLPEDTNNL